jgi:hypothetical protein
MSHAVLKAKPPHRLDRLAPARPGSPPRPGRVPGRSAARAGKRIRLQRRARSPTTHSPREHAATANHDPDLAAGAQLRKVRGPAPSPSGSRPGNLPAGCSAEVGERACAHSKLASELADSTLPMAHRFTRFRRCVQRLRSHPQPIWTFPDAYRATPSAALRYAPPRRRRESSSPRCTGTMEDHNDSVPNSVGSAPWHAVFAGHGDLEEARSSGSQVRVCEASLATALDQRPEMTSHRHEP